MEDSLFPRSSSSSPPIATPSKPEIQLLRRGRQPLLLSNQDFAPPTAGGCSPLPQTVARTLSCSSKLTPRHTCSFPLSPPSRRSPPTSHKRLLSANRASGFPTSSLCLPLFLLSPIPDFKSQQHHHLFASGDAPLRIIPPCPFITPPTTPKTNEPSVQQNDAPLR